MSEELENVTPTEPETAEQAQEVEQTSTDATAEQEQEAEQKADEPKKEPWFQKRISEVTREKYEAKRQAEDARAEAQQLREAMARIQQGEQPNLDVQSIARQEAERIVAQRSFDEACNKVYAEGAKEFTNFDTAVRNLQMVGVSRDFLEIAVASDAGAKLLNHLGNDLDEAARIANLSPVQMARELTKLELKLSVPVVKPVSKAPAPIKTLGAKAVSESGLSDDLPIEEWMRRRNALRKR